MIVTKKALPRRTFLKGAGTALISGNVFSETPQGAIAGYRWNERTTGELADGAEPFAHLTIERNRTG